MEELDTEITVGKLIDTIEYEYPTFHLSMDCFWCEVVKGELVLKEAEDAKWLKKDELGEIAWLPANGGVYREDWNRIGRITKMSNNSEVDYTIDFKVKLFKIL